MPHIRTNIVIDDALMNEALEATGLASRCEVVELGLQTLVRLGHRADTRRFRGQIKWEDERKK